VVKNVDFDDPESMKNADGWVEIPIEDAEHLKKVILTADVSSSAGSSWATAGCAVSINAVDTTGDELWTSKGYSIALGNGKVVEIPFDGTLPKGDDTVSALIADDKIELQKWWDASEKQESEIEDEITVKYTHVQVVYEYESDPKPQPTTVPQTTTEPTTISNVVYGDADCNGEIEIVDAVKIMSFVSNASAYPLSDQGKNNADVYSRGDGLNNSDALSVQKLLANIINSLPESFLE